MIKTKQELTLAYKLPGMNEIIAANRNSKFDGGSQKAHWTDTVAKECKIQRIKPFKHQINTKFIWTCKNKKRDKDNIIAGQKFVFDGLIKAGIIPNDGWNEIGTIEHQFQTGTYDKVQVLMKENLDKKLENI